MDHPVARFHLPKGKPYPTVIGEMEFDAFESTHLRSTWISSKELIGVIKEGKIVARGKCFGRLLRYDKRHWSSMH